MDQYMKNNIIYIVKVILISILIFVLIIIYCYNFTSMYGGKYYQRKSFMSEANVVFMNYHNYQSQYLKEHGKYDQEWHKLFSKTRNFKIGFANEDDFIKKVNPNCMLSETSYRLCAYGKYKDELLFLEVDEDGRRIEKSL